MATSATKITYDEGAAPATPAAAKVETYAKADGLMYSKDDAGVETLMSSGVGSGGVATDAIWDAAGDLAVGSGANTAARLAIGATNGMVLQRVAGAVAWAYPTLTTAEAGLAADLAVSATTYTNLCSVSLAAGTWSIWGVAVYQTVSAATDQYAQLWDGTAQIGQVVSVNSDTGSNYFAVPVFSGGVVLGSTTTIYLRGYSGVATTAKGSTSLGIGGGSKMHALRTA